MKAPSDLWHNPRMMFWLAGAAWLGVSVWSWWIHEPLLLFCPMIVVLAGLAVRFTKGIYFAALASIPFAIELAIPGGSTIEFPSELLMITLLVLVMLWTFRNQAPIGRMILHPITIFLVAHLVWIGISSLDSLEPIISLKYTIAKWWFIGAFYAASWIFLQRHADFRLVFWLLFIGVTSTTVYSLGMHLSSGFSFSEVNKVVQPFYRNHVDYAAMLVLFLPFIGIACSWYKKTEWQFFVLILGSLCIVLGVIFSYTRAAIGLLLLYPLLYTILHVRIVRYVILVGLVSIIALVAYYSNDKRYIELAPNYETTIYHDEFGNLIEATYNWEDLSTMERLYRWVAAGHMISDNPWTGTGPGTFYTAYHSYTVSQFQTYTSDNEEKSGVHNYVLMIVVEQGIIGLLIFLSFLVFLLLFIERLYHQTPHKGLRLWLGMLFCVICGTLLINSINDMLENIKVGAIFFFAIALVAQLSFGYPLIQQRD